MLTLTRKRDEQIVITTPLGEEIAVTVVDINRDRVRLGFEAERTVEIWRSELMPATRKMEAPNG